MKKIIALGLVGLSLTGCLSTNDSFQTHSYRSEPVPDGSTITLQDTKNTVWKTTVEQDEFDGKTIISKVYSVPTGNASLVVRYKESNDDEWGNGFDVYYINGDSYICSATGGSYVWADVLLDGVKSRETPNISTDSKAVFFYTSHVDWKLWGNDWLTKLAKGKKITIRINDGCGEHTKYTFDISGWPKEFYEIQNPKVQSHVENTFNGKDEFIYLTEGKHKEWCAYAESKNFKGGIIAFNQFWISKENWANRMTNYTASERIKRSLAMSALAEKETGSAIGLEKFFFSYSEEMCELI